MGPALRGPPVLARCARLRLAVTLRSVPPSGESRKARSRVKGPLRGPSADPFDTTTTPASLVTYRVGRGVWVDASNLGGWSP